jgi:hypothetical protein
MYAASIVQQRIELAQESLGFPLVYHSPADIDEFNRRLEARYADAYNSARAASQGTEDSTKMFRTAISRALASPDNPKLSKDEVRFIENERALIMCDAAYFMTRYYWIKNRQNNLQRFTFQSGQRILFSVISEMESMRMAIEIILAKARQLGMTTLIEGLILLKVLMGYGVNGVVASADRIKTREMVKMIFMAYDMLPWWIGPNTSRRIESDQGMVVFAGTNAGISFQHGNQTNPIAMGSTPIAYHLSEVSSYPDAEDLIEVGLFKAVHPSPRVFGIQESTCKGDTGYWYDSYWYAKSNWKKHKSRAMALFLPFYCVSDMYPNPTERVSHPVPADWKPVHETRKMIAESEMYVQSNDLLAKVLMADGKPWTISKEQAWYWERNYLAARDRGKEKMWFQEMPHTDRAAFQGSYDNVFGRELIAEIWKERKTAYGVYGIVGQSIEERYEPDKNDIDYEEQVIPVSYRSRKGETYRWELWPLKWEEPFDEIEDIRDDDSHMGKFFVWQHPEPGYDYSIGIDTSNGLSQDATVIAVARRGRTPQEQDVQVAEFRSNTVSHVEAFAWAMAVASYYARYMEDTTQYREPYVAVEQILAVGDTCQLQMSKMGYSRFHQMIRYDSKPKDMRKSRSRKRGWFTSSWSRPMLTDGFVTLVKNGWYKVNSPYTLREMTQWEVHYTAGGKDKFEHSADATDDGIFANAMAGFCPNDMQTMAQRSKKQFTQMVDAGKMPELNIQPRSSYMINPDRGEIMSPESIKRHLRGF